MSSWLVQSGSSWPESFQTDQSLFCLRLNSFNTSLGEDGLLSGYGSGKCSEEKKEVRCCVIHFGNTPENIVKPLGLDVLKLGLSCGNPDSQRQKKWMKLHDSGDSYFLHCNTPNLWNVCWTNKWNEAGAGLCISILFAYFSLGYLLWWLNWPPQRTYFYSFKPKEEFSLSNLCVCACMHTMCMQ